MAHDVDMHGRDAEYPDDAGYPDGEGTLDEGTGAYRSGPTGDETADDDSDDDTGADFETAVEELDAPDARDE